MKASTVLAVLAASVVSAQLDQIPPCALTCAISSLGSTGCGQTDIACICKASSFLAALTPCVQTSCSPADLQKTIQAATGLCLSASVTLSIPTAPASSALASASSVASSILVSASSSASSAVYASISSIASSFSSVYVSSISSVYTNATATTYIPVPIPTGNVTYTTGAPVPTGTTVPVPTPSGNAAGRNAVAFGGLGVAAVAIAAVLL